METVEQPQTAQVPATSVEPRKLDWVDSVRGWAVLGVIAVHVVQIFPDLWKPAYNLLHSGMYGVQLFFVVSAFTMLHSWNSRRDESHKTAKFFIRRFFRIAPMFYLGIPLYTAFFYVFAKSLPAPLDVGLTVAFLHGFSYSAINKVVAGGWSIGVEFAFYALIPFLARRVVSVSTAVVTVVIGLALVAANYGYLLASGAPAKEFTDYSFFFYWLPNQFFVFGLGFVLYWLWKPSGLAQISARWGSILLWSSIAALVVVGAFRPTYVLSHLPFSLLYLPLVIGLAIARPAVLVNRWVGSIGVNSFSIYIWQFAIIGAMGRVWNKFGDALPDIVGLALVFAVATGLSYILSELSRMWIEEPGQALGRKLIARLG